MFIWSVPDGRKRSFPILPSDALGPGNGVPPLVKLYIAHLHDIIHGYHVKQIKWYKVIYVIKIASVSRFIGVRSVHTKTHTKRLLLTHPLRICQKDDFTMIPLTSREFFLPRVLRRCVNKVGVSSKTKC